MTWLFIIVSVFGLVMWALATVMQQGPPSVAVGLLLSGVFLLGLPALLLGVLAKVGRKNARRRADQRMRRADAPSFGSGEEILLAGALERRARWWERGVWLMVPVLFAPIVLFGRIEFLAISIAVGVVAVVLGIANAGRTRIGVIKLARYVNERKGRVCPRCFYDTIPEPDDPERSVCVECGHSYNNEVLREEWTMREGVSSRPWSYRFMHVKGEEF